MRSLFVNDGQEFVGTFTATDWPSLTFTYRPASAEEVREYQIRSGRANIGADVNRAMLNLLFPDNAEQRLRSWDATDGKGGAAAVSKDLFLRLPTPVQQIIVDHVCRYVLGREASEAAKN